MEPITKKKAGRELGNAAACGKLAGISWESFQWYVRTKRPAGNPPPAHVEIDNETGQRMYPLKEVRAWQKRRPGRGNWGGIGARARVRPESLDAIVADEVTTGEAAAQRVTVAPITTNDVVEGTAVASAVSSGRIEQTPVRGPGQ